ncbi:MAG: hypothetical protein ACFFA3_07730 [Promethearchaeota archaeon]
MSEKISIRSNCPICNKTIIFDIDKEFILKSDRFPVQFLVEHCNASLIAYVDENFEVKGIEPVNNIIKKRTQTNDNNIEEELIIPSVIPATKLEEKLVLSSNYDVEYITKEIFPNVIEKQVILQISKSNKISIPSLLQKLSILNKAINRTIDQESILKIIDKYVEKGMINKQFIKIEKNNHKLNDIKTTLRGDVM